MNNVSESTGSAGVLNTEGPSSETVLRELMPGCETLRVRIVIS